MNLVMEKDIKTEAAKPRSRGDEPVNHAGLGRRRDKTPLTRG